MIKQYIGDKKIKNFEETDETTSMGTKIFKVTFEDGHVEKFSKTMLEVVADKEPCDLTALRDKRVMPVIKMLLGIMEEWGIKVGELPYIAQLLNRSIDANTDEALFKLLEPWMPKPKSLDDIDLVTINRILKSTGA